LSVFHWGPPLQRGRVWAPAVFMGDCRALNNISLHGGAEGSAASLD
jgi:hypothetical protein